MKRLITLLLCASLTLTPIQQPRSQSVVVLCVGISVAILAGYCIIRVMACHPTVKCIHEGDPGETGTNWCAAITRRQAESSGWQVMGTYPDFLTCSTNCARNPKGGVAPMGPGTLTGTVRIWRSEDLIHWTVCAEGSVYDDEVFLEYREPQGNRCFYRHEVVVSE